MSNPNQHRPGSEGSDASSANGLGALFELLRESRGLFSAIGIPIMQALLSSANGTQGTERHVIIFMTRPTGDGSPFMSDYVSDAGLQPVLDRLAMLFQAQGPPPASQKALDCLPMVGVDETVIAETTRCSICFDNYVLGNMVCKLPCSHTFDKECVVEWLKKHHTCPICRYELPTDDPERDRDRRERMAARGINEDELYGRMKEHDQEREHWGDIASDQQGKAQTEKKRKREEENEGKEEDEEGEDKKDEEEAIEGEEKEPKIETRRKGRKRQKIDQSEEKENTADHKGREHKKAKRRRTGSRNDRRSKDKKEKS